jgi:hypothetical protein
MGILDLDKFVHALRLCWLWLEWTALDKPWVGLETPNDEVDRSLFNVATKVTIGDRHKASFWTSSWLDAKPPKLIAPMIYEASKRKRTAQSMMLWPTIDGLSTSLLPTS